MNTCLSMRNFNNPIMLVQAPLIAPNIRKGIHHVCDFVFTRPTSTFVFIETKHAFIITSKMMIYSSIHLHILHRH